MTAHQISKHLPKKIAIMRSLPGLGDLLCTVPALRALRATFESAKITLIGLATARSNVERFSHYIDEFLEFPGYPGIPEVPPPYKLPEFLASVQQQRFDLALQMHGSGIVSNNFTVSLGASVNAGFYLPGHYCPDPDYFLPYPSDEPEVWRHLLLMEHLGIPLQGTDLEFPLTEEDESALQAIDEVSSLRKGEYVCVHPGASVPERRWNADSFAVVADAIADRGFQVVLTGTAAEASLTLRVAEKMRTEPINLAGRTNLGAIAALLSNAALLVCNDTGVSHLAAALRVKSVVIFTNSEPHRWAPLDRKRHRIITGVEETRKRGETRERVNSPLSPLSTADASTLGTRARRCLPLSPVPHYPITTDTVIAEVEDLLKKEVVNVT